MFCLHSRKAATKEVAPTPPRWALCTIAGSMLHSDLWKTKVYNTMNLHNEEILGSARAVVFLFFLFLHRPRIKLLGWMAVSCMAVQSWACKQDKSRASNFPSQNAKCDRSKRRTIIVATDLCHSIMCWQAGPGGSWNQLGHTCLLRRGTLRLKRS